MHLPQAFMLAFLSVTLLLTAHDHGKPKTGKDNFWAALITVGIIVGLLCWGGFFRR